MIGERIKQLRMERGMTQYDLANGICTQSHISRIEKGPHTPSTYILKQFAMRLNVPLDYLYSGIKDYNLEAFKNKVYDLVESEDYSKLALILQDDVNNFKTKYEEQYIYWIRAIVSDKVDKSKRNAIKYIDKALQVQSEVDDPYFKIHLLNSSIIIKHGLLTNKEMDDTYNLIIDIMEKEKLAYKMSIKILLSIATYNFHKGNFHKVYKCSKCAVEILESSNSNYFSEYHLYNYTYSSFILGLYNKDMHNRLLLAKQLATVKENRELLNCINIALTEIQESKVVTY